VSSVLAVAGVVGAPGAAPVSGSVPPLATFTFQEWMWSGGLIEISLVLTALLGAFWLVSRQS
jgi:hypothetical protein